MVAKGTLDHRWEKRERRIILDGASSEYDEHGAGEFLPRTVTAEWLWVSERSVGKWFLVGAELEGPLLESVKVYELQLTRGTCTYRESKDIPSWLLPIIEENCPER